MGLTGRPGRGLAAPSGRAGPCGALLAVVVVLASVTDASVTDASAAAPVAGSLHAAPAVPSLPGQPDAPDGPGGAPPPGTEGLSALLLDGEPLPGLALSSAVAAVPSESAELERATRELDDLVERQDRATRRAAQVAAELAALAIEVRALDGIVERRDAQIDKARATHERLRRALGEVAIEWFITGFGALDGLDPALTAQERSELTHHYVLSQAGAGDALADEQRTARRLDELVAERDGFERRRSDAVAAEARLAAEAEELAEVLAEAEERRPEAERRVAVEKMSARITGTDMSATALDAYWRAAARLARDDAECAVPWWALAGIGRTESRHGTYRGARLAVDGSISPAIHGPPLDGSNGFAVVPDSDGGALDGTAATDRAVGPMQFLPGTWRMVGEDGTGDDVADPHNMFDAAVGAARYLCRSGPRLDREDALRRALFTYNRSLEYVRIVIERGLDYRDAVDLDVRTAG